MSLLVIMCVFMAFLVIGFIMFMVSAYDRFNAIGEWLQKLTGAYVSIIEILDKIDRKNLQLDMRLTRIDTRKHNKENYRIDNCDEVER